MVLPLGGHPHAAMFDAGTSRLAVLSPGPQPTAPAFITVISAAQPPQAVALPGPRPR
ncbi:conserved lipoLppL domain protein [Mycobacterium xenopi 3993]|nr:conserved lipoLppL domain protein [Mycobacterium xenopi 3993]